MEDKMNEAGDTNNFLSRHSIEINISWELLIKKKGLGKINKNKISNYLSQYIHIVLQSEYKCWFKALLTYLVSWQL